MTKREVPTATANKKTGAQKFLFENVERLVYPFGARSPETRDMQFTAGLVQLQLLGATFKATHDELTGSLPYNRCTDEELKDLKQRLEPWGWTWDEDEECFSTFYPGG